MRYLQSFKILIENTKNKILKDNIIMFDEEYKFKVE